MTWILTGLIELLLGALAKIFQTISGSFITNFGINIGASFSTAEKVVPFETTISTVGKDSSLFGVVFSTAQSFNTVIMTLALVLVIIITFFNLAKAMTSLNLRETEHPVTIAIRSVFTMVAVFISHTVFVIFEYLFNQVYIQFMNVNIKSSGAVVTNRIQDFATGADGGFAAEVSGFFSPEHIVKMMGENNPGNSLLVSIIGLICLLAVLINFFKLLLEIVQRYVLLGVFYYTCPLPVACLSSKSTSAVFSSWVRMVMSQFILLIISIFFLSTFYSSISTFSTANTEGGIMVYFSYIFFLVSWLLIAQRVDEYMKGIGLSTAQLGTSLWGAAAGAVGTLMAASSLFRGGRNPDKTDSSPDKAGGAGKFDRKPSYNSMEMGNKNAGGSFGSGGNKPFSFDDVKFSDNIEKASAENGIEALKNTGASDELVSAFERGYDAGDASIAPSFNDDGSGTSGAMVQFSDGSFFEYGGSDGKGISIGSENSMAAGFAQSNGFSTEAGNLTSVDKNDNITYRGKTFTAQEKFDMNKLFGSGMVNSDEALKRELKIREERIGKK